MAQSAIAAEPRPRINCETPAISQPLRRKSPMQEEGFIYDADSPGQATIGDRSFSKKEKKLVHLSSRGNGAARAV